MTTLYSIIESPAHPDLSKFYNRYGFKQLKFNSQRKAISALKKEKPDFVVAEFFYGYGNNYAGVNVSNLDVFLHSQRKYAPEAKIIVLAQPREYPHVQKLAELFPLHAVIRLPLREDMMVDALGIQA